MSLPDHVRIGSVPFLNARPLIYGIEDRVTLCPPSQLADLMSRGQFEVGLVPIAEVLLHDQYNVVDGMAIASHGAVQSVFLAHRSPIDQLRRVAVDPASRTSVWLLRVILKAGYYVEPEFYPRPNGAKLSDHEAMMLIGDDALWYRTRHEDSAANLLDLGESWLELTGLPFVYAAWALQREIEAGPVAQLLRRAKTDGLAHIEQIAQDSTEATVEFRREYLTRYVRYDLGEPEKRGIKRFQQFVKDLGLVDQTNDLRYVS